MTLKLINSNNKVIEKNFEELLKEVKPNSFFYFHKETPHKNLKNLIDKLEEYGYAVFRIEVKYALDEGSYMYELHII